MGAFHNPIWLGMQEIAVFVEGARYARQFNDGCVMGWVWAPIPNLAPYAAEYGLVKQEKLTVADSFSSEPPIVNSYFSKTENVNNSEK